MESKIETVQSQPIGGSVTSSLLFGQVFTFFSDPPFILIIAPNLALEIRQDNVSYFSSKPIGFEVLRALQVVDALDGLGFLVGAKR